MNKKIEYLVLQGALKKNGVKSIIMILTNLFKKLDK